jgi:hypothetical protein
MSTLEREVEGFFNVEVPNQGREAESDREVGLKL